MQLGKKQPEKYAKLVFKITKRNTPAMTGDPIRTITFSAEEVAAYHGLPIPRVGDKICVDGMWAIVKELVYMYAHNIDPYVEIKADETKPGNSLLKGIDKEELEEAPSEEIPEEPAVMDD